MLDTINGEPVVWQLLENPMSRVISESGSNPFKMIGKSLKGAYTMKMDLCAITRTHAYVLHMSKKVIMGKMMSATGEDIKESCSLINTLVSVSNKSENIDTRYYQGTPTGTFNPPSRGTYIVTVREFGNVDFFQNGQKVMMFNKISNPDSVVHLINALRNQRENHVQLVQTQNELDNEVEMWNFGPTPLKVQFGDKKDTKGCLVRYVLTNKHAYITGEGGDGHIKKVHFQPLGNVLIAPIDWNGGIISQISLNNADMVISDRKEIGDGDSRLLIPHGNINFIRGQEPPLIFYDVEFPDNFFPLLKLIRTVESTKN